jgi:hypothetical protein
MSVDWREILRPDVPLHPGIGHQSRRLHSAARLPTGEWINEYDRPARLGVHRGCGQNGMSANYQSLTDGLVLMATIVFWSLAMNAAAYRWAWVARPMKPKPVLLIEGGRFRRRNMRRELVTEEELRSELRKRGVHDLAGLESVQMESDGEISVVPKETGEEGQAGKDRQKRQGRYRSSRR